MSDQQSLGCLDGEWGGAGVCRCLTVSPTILAQRRAWLEQGTLIDASSPCVFGDFCGLSACASLKINEDVDVYACPRLVVGDAFRRLVARACYATFQAVCMDFQLGLSTRAGIEALFKLLQVATECYSRTTVLSVDAIGAFDSQHQRQPHARREAPVCCSGRSTRTRARRRKGV